MILSKGRGVRLNSSDSNSSLSEITTSNLFILCILVLSTKITNYARIIHHKDYRYIKSIIQG